jgi:hypothetical protein
MSRAANRSPRLAVSRLRKGSVVSDGEGISMISSFKGRCVSPRQRWGGVLAGVIVVVAVLTLAPAAFADGWSLQSVPLPRSPGVTRLNAVACPATNDCYAVGFDTPAGVGSEPTALIEKWNGTEWFVFNLGGTAGELNSVSCPTTSFCEAVGDYRPFSVDVPLVYTWGSGGFQQQNVPVEGTLNGVSCQSASFCLAVGVETFPRFGPLNEEWTGSTFGQLPSGNHTPDANLYAVSCAAGQIFYCLSVGQEQTADGQDRPLVEQFDDGSLETITNTGDGRFVVQPSGTSNAKLTGVYCLFSTDCQAVGTYVSSTTGQVNPWAAETTSSGWTLESVPPATGDAAFGSGDALTCPNECWAVGYYEAASGQQPLADTLNGPSWALATVPGPSGTHPVLDGVACAQINYCEAVGDYQNSAGNVVPFAEQYFYSMPSGCQHPPCRPPQPGTPHHFALTAHDTEAHGATVIAVLRKPRTLVLLVQGTRRHYHVIIGLVLLGRYPVGTFWIPWNLRVAGKRLSKGTYEVTLHSISIDVLSPDTPPGEISLTVKANGQLSVEK